MQKRLFYDIGLAKTCIRTLPGCYGGTGIGSTVCHIRKTLTTVKKEIPKGTFQNKPSYWCAINPVYERRQYSLK
jgi:hypothetical protein